MAERDILQDLMGYGLESDVDTPERQQARVNALRGQLDYGQMLSLSPTKSVSGLGQSMTNRVYDQAETIGTNRKSALARTRQALLDREKREQTDVLNERADQSFYATQNDRATNVAAAVRSEDRDINQTAYDRTGFDNASLEWRKEGDEYYQWGKDLSDNVMKEVPNSRSDTPPYKAPNITKYEGVKQRMMNVPGMPSAKMLVNFDADGTIQEITFNGTQYPTAEAFAAANTDIPGLTAANVYQEAYSKSGANEQAKTDVQRFTEYEDSVYASIDSLYKAQPAWAKIHEGSKEGGVLGPNWYQDLPSLKDETAQVMQGVNALTLATLGSEDSLVPVSDRDAKTLQGKAVPNYWGEQMVSYSKHEMELNRRLIAAQEHKAQWVTQNGRVPRGNEAKQLRKEMQDIVYAVDETGLPFDITHRLSPEKREVGELNGRTVTVKDLIFVQKRYGLQDKNLGEVWAEAQRIDANRQNRLGNAQ